MVSDLDGVVLGHHLRHEVKHKAVVGRIHNGAIGDVKYVRAYFNSSGARVRPRQPDQSEMKRPVRTWYYFTWFSGVSYRGCG